MTEARDLPLADRRELLKAARDLNRLAIATAVRQFVGTAPQNFNAWLAGKDSALSAPRQLFALDMFGFTPFGQLSSECLHAWVLHGREQVPQLETMFTFERELQDISVSFAFTKVGIPPTDDENEEGEGADEKKETQKNQLIGAAIRWISPTYSSTQAPELQERRLIITAMAGTWTSVDEFKHFVLDFFAEKAKPRKLIEGPELHVNAAVAENVWRWYIKDTRRTKSRQSVTPKVVGRIRLLNKDQDLVGKPDATIAQSPRDVLNEMLPRFETVTGELAGERKARVGPGDLSMIYRARATLGLPMVAEAPNVAIRTIRRNENYAKKMKSAEGQAPAAAGKAPKKAPAAKKA